MDGCHRCPLYCPEADVPGSAQGVVRVGELNHQHDLRACANLAIKVLYSFFQISSPRRSVL